MELSTVGLWSPTFLWGGPARRDVAAELDELGYGALWIGAAPGDLELVEDILDTTSRLVVATGIVNIWLSDAAELAAAYHRVAERFADRFVLGIGMGHAPAAE
ncbi:MAG: LLM class flavin-dependent oxidoreductase, partial [Jiangellaceae bacterium]